MLAPASLLLPEPLFQRWPEVLARGGAQVAWTGGKAVVTARDARLELHLDATANGGTCSLELVTDTAWRRRLEAVFLASGASLQDPNDITPVVRALYRVGEAQSAHLQTTWLREGAALDRPGPWHGAHNAFPAGELRGPGARLPLETGPALAPDGTPVLYLDLLPRFVLRPGAALLALIQRGDRQLLEAGATVIHRFGSNP